MSFRFLANIIVLFHFVFILFAVLGGILCIWRWKMIWLHIPVVLWAALIEFRGWICPLTPLENWLRVRGEEAGYLDGFIEHYVMPVVYPVGLTREVQVALGALVIAINSLIYWRVCMVHNPGLFRRKG